MKIADLEALVRKAIKLAKRDGVLVVPGRYQQEVALDGKPVTCMCVRGALEYAKPFARDELTPKSAAQLSALEAGFEAWGGYAASGAYKLGAKLRKEQLATRLGKRYVAEVWGK